MKKFLKLLPLAALCLFLAASAHAQTVVSFNGVSLGWQQQGVPTPTYTTVVPIPYNGVPSGSCSATQTAVNITNGNLYTCIAPSLTATNGTWTLAGGGGSGVTFAGDLAGTNTSQTVVGLEGNSFATNTGFVSNTTGAITFVAGAGGGTSVLQCTVGSLTQGDYFGPNGSSICAELTPGLTFNNQSGAGYTLVSTDRTKVVQLTNAGAQVLNIPQTGSTGFTGGFYGTIANFNGAGTWTLKSTTSTINGVAGATGVALPEGQWCGLGTPDGSNWVCLGSPGFLTVTSPVVSTSAAYGTVLSCPTCATSAASLTNNAIVTGAGSQGLQTPSATSTLSASGNMVLAGTATATSFTSTGTTAGFVDYPQGTTSSAVAPCNTATSICEQAPASVTSYLLNKPGTAANGIAVGINNSGTITQNFTGSSAYTVGPVTIGTGTSISATSLCSTTNCIAGNYDVAAYVEITTGCTTTGSYIVWLGWTDDGSAKNGSSTTTFFPFPLNGSGVPTTVGTIVPDAAGNYAQAHIFLHTTGAANNSLGSINYGTTAGACGTGGPMVGKLWLTVVPLS